MRITRAHVHRGMRGKSRHVPHGSYGAGTYETCRCGAVHYLENVDGSAQRVDRGWAQAHYALADGRHILRNGVPIAYVERVGSDAGGYALAPWEADDLAHAIVAALQAVDYTAGQLRERSYGKKH